MVYECVQMVSGRWDHIPKSGYRNQESLNNAVDLQPFFSDSQDLGLQTFLHDGDSVIVTTDAALRPLTGNYAGYCSKQLVDLGSCHPEAMNRK